MRLGNEENKGGRFFYQREETITKKIDNFSVMATYIYWILVPSTLVFCALCPDFPSVEKTDRIEGVHDGTCYTYLSDGKENWHDAKFLCKRNGWHLLQIKTSAEDNFYEALIRRDTMVHGCLWMGLSDSEEEGKWKWLDGSEATYQRVHYNVFDIFTKWGFDCIKFCQPYDENRPRWVQTKCNTGTATGVLCETDSLPATETTVHISTNSETATVVNVETTGLARENRKKNAGRVRRRRRPSPEKVPVFTVVDNLIGYRLISKPVQITREFSNTMCARRCTPRADCVLYNFHGPTGSCVLYSKKTVLQGESQQENGWEVWFAEH